MKVTASKAVVLACGDFSGNGAMVYALMDEIRNLITTRHLEIDDTAKLNGMSQDGSGIKMGLWAGGMMEAGPPKLCWVGWERLAGYARAVRGFVVN